MTGSKAQPASRDWLWTLAFALFAITVMLSINAVKLAVGPLPVRTLTLLASGGTILVANSHALGKAWRETSRALLVIVLAALLGIVVSLVARIPGGEIIQQLIEIHVQALIGIVVAYALILRYGPKPILIAFLAAYGFSALFAIGQALGIDLAWQARAMIGRITHDNETTQIAYVTRYRALGLSYSPVLFATQTCLAVVAFFCLRLVSPSRPSQGMDWLLLGGCFIFGLLSMATGNRSPLLGIVIFIVIYCMIRGARLLLAFLPLVLIAGMAAQPMMSSLDNAGVRVASTDDGSAEGRSTLRRYGIFLLTQRPIGYGLTFDSTQHWQSFAHQVRYRANPMAIRQWALHNYYLMILGKYGLFLIALLALLIPTRRASLFLGLAFVPYMVHIFYHNDGPLQGDFLIFYILAGVVWLARHPERWTGTTALETRVKPWRRAFAQQAS